MKKTAQESPLRKTHLNAETIRVLTLNEHRNVNGGYVCSTTTTISEQRCGGGGGNTGMLCNTFEAPCTVAPF